MLVIVFAILNVSALAVLFVLLQHTYRLVQTLNSEEWLPLVEQTAAACKEQAHILRLTEEIHAQLHSDSGLSIKDAVNRLDVAAKQQFEAAEFLKAGVREDRHKAELDRDQLQRLLIELHRLTIKVESNVATLNRVEIAAEGVAQDLSDAHKRADAVVGGDHGAAADAASQQTQKEKDENG